MDAIRCTDRELVAGQLSARPTKAVDGYGKSRVCIVLERMRARPKLAGLFRAFTGKHSGRRLKEGGFP